MWLFPMGAAAVSGVFTAMLGAQWWERRKPHLFAWAVALLMFTVASFAAAIGLLVEWTATWYRVYYLFGAILNVPVLGLGTLYLLGPHRIARAFGLLVIVASVFAAGAVTTATIDASVLATEQIPAGSEVMPDGVRALSRYYSFTGFFIVVGGALWSAWRLARSRQDALRELVKANVLIAAGTTIVAVASVFARFGRGAVFAIGLLIGVSAMFAGFLKARTPASS
jgi:hypothetical protein